MSSEPTIFGRYQLLERIAKGGMAEVFRAKLVAAAGTEKVVCIKRILPDFSKNQEFISLFVKEAKISLSLTHGNITQVFDFGEVDGVYYLAMEYISGQDLSAVLRRIGEIGGRLELPAVLYMAAEVCKGLQYAHTFTDGEGKTHAVVHRDVTPHNILISYTGQVKLTDFGIALAATKVSTGRSTEVVRGKACYLSPEQAEGNQGEPRSDIFSLGAVVYEMLTGVRLFDADSESEILDRVRSHEVEPPSQLNEEVDPELDAAVLRALARAPGERYSRAGDLQVVLNQLLVKRWPDYTAENLSESIKELFDWEIAQGDGAGGEKSRDRLLFQLARAGIEVEDKNATTSELLELGTVAISGSSLQAGISGGKKVLLAASGVAIAILVAVVVWVMNPSTNGTELAKRDASGAPPPTLRHHIERPEPQEPQPYLPPVTSPAKKVKSHPPKVAYINCNSWPWSVVYINGRKLRGNTPLFRVRVMAGRHRIRFVNPELGLSKEVTVSVEAGNTKTVAVSLQQ